MVVFGITKNRKSCLSYLNYSMQKLKIHLESLFEPWMTWENYGSRWHVDHVVALSAFNIVSIDSPDLRRAWALSNLRPLEAKENIRKGRRLSAPMQPSLPA